MPATNTSPELLSAYALGDVVEAQLAYRGHWRPGVVTAKYVPLAYLGVTMDLSGAELQVIDPARVRRA